MVRRISKLRQYLQDELHKFQLYIKLDVNLHDKCFMSNPSQ